MEFAEKRKNWICRKDVPPICACASAAVFLTAVAVYGIGAALTAVPMLFAVPATAFFAFREKKIAVRYEEIMNEAPSAVGMMRLMADRGHSLDSAVREVALNGPPNIRKMFAKIVWDADTRASADIRKPLVEMLTALPEKLAAFRRSMFLIMSASDSGSAEERTGMTKDANDTILEGLKEMGESYSAGLNAPCMTVFGLGVMVPMIMISILPMLTVGGQFASSPLDPAVIALITLVMIPAAVAGVIMMISGKNPFYVRSDEKIRMRHIISAAVCIPVFASAYMFTNDPAMSMAAAAVCSGIAMFATLHPDAARERKRAVTETMMSDALFDLGNRLLSGENFETALISSFRERNGCAELASSLERCIAVSRGDTADALRRAMNVFSKKIAHIYCDVYLLSLKDLRDAGRSAVSVGHQLQDQTATVRGIQNKLRSMTDMMTGTSSVFAPLILGISVSMLAPLMSLAGSSQMPFTGPILITYLTELAALISVLTAQLRCRGGVTAAMYSFSIMMPVAIVIFLISSNIPI